MTAPPTQPSALDAPPLADNSKKQGAPTQAPALAGSDNSKKQPHLGGPAAVPNEAATAEHLGTAPAPAGGAAADGGAAPAGGAAADGGAAPAGGAAADGGAAPAGGAAADAGAAAGSAAAGGTAPRARRALAAPLLVAVSGWLVLGVTSLPVAHLVWPVAVFGFALTVPGAALVRLLPVTEPLERAVLAVALSLSAAAIASEATYISHLLRPAAVLAGLATLCSVAAAAELARGVRGV